MPASPQPKKGKTMADKITATWDISLWVDCPKCWHYVNLLDADDFWEGRELDCAEHGTDRSRGVTVECPDCAHEFVVNLEY